MKSASVENALSSLKEALVKCPEGVDTTSWLTEQLAVILGIAEQTWREEQDEGNKYEHLRIIAKGVADLARDGESLKLTYLYNTSRPLLTRC